MDIKIHQPHDSFTRRILSDIEVARALIKTHVPTDVVKRIDFDSIQLTNKSFVSEELQQLHSDIIYKCTIDNKQAFVYTLVEHQSTPDERLPLRMLEYNVMLMKQHLDEGNKKLPLIINVCLYAGNQSPYPYSTDIMDYFEDVSLAKKRMFKPFKLIDLTTSTPEQLLADGALGVIEVLLKQGREKDHLDWIRKNPVLIYEITSGPFGLSSVMYIFGTDDKNKPKELLEAIIKAAPANKEIIMSAAQKLQEEARKEGMELGIQTKAQAIAKNMLKKGYAIKDIQEITGLTREAIEKLIKE